MEKSQITENADGTMRSLSNRNVQMIAIGGTIGTGLFLGSGTTISKTGPSILLVYLVLGIFFFLMMRAIGEMLYSDPSQHTFVAFITRYLGPTVGHFTGWTYWLGLSFCAMLKSQPFLLTFNSGSPISLVDYSISLPGNFGFS